MFEFIRRKKGRLELALEASPDKISSPSALPPSDESRLSPIAEWSTKKRARYFSVPTTKFEELGVSPHPAKSKRPRRSSLLLRSPTVKSEAPRPTYNPYPTRPGQNRSRSSSHSVMSLHNPFRRNTGDSHPSTSQLELERPFQDAVVASASMGCVVSYAPVLVSPKAESAEVLFARAVHDGLSAPASIAEDRPSSSVDDESAASEFEVHTPEMVVSDSLSIEKGHGAVDFLRVSIPVGVISPMAEPAHDSWANP